MKNCIKFPLFYTIKPMTLHNTPKLHVLTAEYCNQNLFKREWVKEVNSYSKLCLWSPILNSTQ
jgi:hypothetical protein